MSEQALSGLLERMARQKERMNTHQEKYESALDRLRADMAKRDKDNLRWLIGLWIATIVVISVVVHLPI